MKKEIKKILIKLLIVTILVCILNEIILIRSTKRIEEKTFLYLDSLINNPHITDEGCIIKQKKDR